MCCMCGHLFLGPAELRAEIALASEWYRPPRNSFAVGQCTWFAYGRMQESGFIYGTVATTKQKKSILSCLGGNAGGWSARAAAAGFETGAEARAEAIACWISYPGKEGHVAFVETVSDRQPFVTEANVSPATSLRIVTMANFAKDLAWVFKEKFTIADQDISLVREQLQLKLPLGQVPVGRSRRVLSTADVATTKAGFRVGWFEIEVQPEDFTADMALLQNKLPLSCWCWRIYEPKESEGNFTGINLTPAKPAYGHTAEITYIYLSSAGDSSTSPKPTPSAGTLALKLRSALGFTQPIVASVPEGTTLQVVEGPVQAGECVWWKLSGDPGTGWAAVKSKTSTIFQAPKGCPVEVTADLLWFHGSIKAQGTFYIATHGNGLMKQPSINSLKIRDLPVGTEDTVIGGPTSADGRVWWNLTVGPDTGWAVVDRWGFNYPKD